MQTLYDRHYDGRPETGNDVFTVALDPCPADEDDDDNRKWSEHYM